MNIIIKILKHNEHKLNGRIVINYVVHVPRF